MNSKLSSEQAVNDVHVQMWKHYDDLRQKKNTTFLTANIILLAIAGFSSNNAPELIAAIAALGTIIEIAWFLLLTRNDAYIRFHRDRVGAEWRPATWPPSSSLLDRTLPVAFGAFWIFLLGRQIW
jgi:hypothetical protein